VPRVERGGNGALRHRAEIGRDPCAAVVTEQRHPVTALDAESLELSPVARDEPGGLAVGDRAPTVRLVDEDRLGRAFRPVEQEFRQGLSHCPVDARILWTARSQINQRW
jgi:hypothetical protein